MLNKWAINPKKYFYCSFTRIFPEGKKPGMKTAVFQTIQYLY